MEMDRVGRELKEHWPISPPSLFRKRERERERERERKKVQTDRNMEGIVAKLQRKSNNRINSIGFRSVGPCYTSGSN